MKIFPAIDIKDKKCVRLIKGDFNQKTEYEMSPVEQATQFIDKGFKNLHIIDLDGALTGETVNLNIIQEIVKKFDLKNIKTLADTCTGGYMKMGIYRHRTIGYWNSDWESLQDQTVYLDSIVLRKPKKDEKFKKSK